MLPNLTTVLAIIDKLSWAFKDALKYAATYEHHDRKVKAKTKNIKLTSIHQKKRRPTRHKQYERLKINTTI